MVCIDAWNRNELCFEGFDPESGRLTNQNRGHLGSGYAHMQIYMHEYI